MKIAFIKYYNGAEERIERLGIEMFHEVVNLLKNIKLSVLEEKDTNSGAAVRELIDKSFAKHSGWSKTQTGGIDWRKCRIVDGTEVCIGVEVQVSARSDLVVIDIMHLRDAIENGSIDVGVIIVPSDQLSYFLTDRAPSFKETTSAIENRMRSANLPLAVIAIEHDSAGKALPKRRKK